MLRALLAMKLITEEECKKIGLETVIEEFEIDSPEIYEAKFKVTKPEIVEFKPQEKSFDNDIQSYREFLEKRKETMIRPNRVELPKGYNDLTESYSAMRRREMRNNQQEKNTNINNLDPEIKALLIAGILDRKF